MHPWAGACTPTSAFQPDCAATVVINSNSLSIYGVPAPECLTSPLSLRPILAMSPPTTEVVYSQQLLKAGHGLPLWHPETDPLSGEILIGDVGFVTKGKFVRMFNVTASAEDSVNKTP